MGLLGTCHNMLPSCAHPLKLAMQSCEKSNHLIQTNYGQNNPVFNGLALAVKSNAVFLFSKHVVFIVDLLVVRRDQILDRCGRYK